MITIHNKGANEGKTYITQKDNVEHLHTDKVVVFNKWFEANYKDLERYLKGRNRFDGSLLSDAYLRIHDNILYRGTDIENYKGFFLSTYFRLLLDNEVDKNEFSELFSSLEKDITIAEHTNEQEDNTGIKEKIFEYVYSFYSLQDFEIFKMYINMQRDGYQFSLRSLSKIINKRFWTVFRIVSGIKKDIIKNYDKILSGGVYYMNDDTPTKQLDKSYLLSRDYDTLWILRTKRSYTVICTVDKNGSKCVANMTPFGEIFAGETCYSDFEGISKSEFIKQCDELGVEYIKPNFPEAVQTSLF